MTRVFRKDQQGAAMVVAIGVVSIISMLTVYVAQNALHQLNTTASDRQRTVTVDSAEGGIDLAISKMQTATTLTGATGLPCGIPGSLATAPTTASYSVAITYYSSTGANLSTAGCPAPSGSETYYTGSTTPASALILSQGSSNSSAYGNQAMEANVQLTPATTSGAIGSDAIYSGGAMTWKDAVTVTDPSHNANVYSGGDLGCSLTPGNATIQGWIHVQGSLTVGGGQACNTTGDWWTLNYVDDQGSGSTVGGSIISGTTGATFNCGGAYPTASVCLNGTGSVSGSQGVVAAGTIDNVHTEPVTHGLHPGTSPAPGGPPSQTLPQLNFVSSNWTAAGWNVITEANNGCTQAKTDVASMSTATQPTVIYVPGTCQMWWSSDLSLSLNNNLVVFAEGGFYFQGRLTVTAGSSATKLYLVVPYAKGDGGTGGTNACGTPPTGGGNPNWPTNPVQQTPGLYVGNTFTEPTSNFNTLFYTPCSIYMPNGFTGDYGQVYGGTVYFDHPIIFTYQAALIPGYGASGTNKLNVTLLYKRQVT